MSESTPQKPTPGEADAGRVYRRRDGRWAAQLRLELSGGRRKTITTHHSSRAEAEADLAEMQQNLDALKLLAERPLPFF